MDQGEHMCSEDSTVLSAQKGLLEGYRTVTESLEEDYKEPGTKGKVIVSIQSKLLFSEDR